MKVAKYGNFITQNVAPKEAVKIGLYNSKGKRVVGIPLKTLSFPNLGDKLYTFGVLSDVHLQRNTGTADFIRALRYLNEMEDVSFTCVCGDLTQNGTEEQLSEYKEYVDTYSADTPVYSISGNHETYGSLDIPNIIETYTGQPLFYSFTQGNDVFIMIGIKGEVTLFIDDEIQWLYEILEANRNKRCFLFMHVLQGAGNTEICGNAYGLYHNYCWSNETQTAIFESLLKHYKNAIWFHGHSHFKFEMQSADCKYANYDDSLGYKSVHIPSITVPREEDNNGDGSADSNEAGSQGYVIDVYENAVILRGRDFVSGNFLPIATYCIDTTLQTVSEGTYRDNTGTIITL